MLKSLGVTIHIEKIQTGTQRSSRASGYRPDIDGLRAIAVVSVVLFHINVPFLSGGYVGVDIFFVISGYLIGSHVYAQTKNHSFTLKDFYRKRTKRILPALFAVILFCYVAGWLLLTSIELSKLSGFVVSTILSGSNIWAWLSSNYFAAEASQNPLLMTWSLGVEEQFYIFFPLLMLLCARVGRRQLITWTVLVTALSFAVCIVATGHRPPFAYYLLPARAWELSAGFILALYENGQSSMGLYGRQRWATWTSLLGLALIAVSVICYTPQTAFPGVAATLPVVGAALLIASPAGWINANVLSRKPVTAIGKISYSLYLWHWPLLSFAHIISDKPLPIAVGCGLGLLATGLATLSYLYIEKPFRNSEAATGVLFLRYACLSLVLLVPGIVFLFGHGFPSHTPTVSAAEKQLSAITHSCWGDRSPSLARECVDFNDPRPAVVLWGDSHAEAMGDTARTLAAQSGFKFYEVVKSSCAPLQGVSTYRVTTILEKDCIDYNAAALKLLTSRPEVKIVVMMAYWENPTVDGISYVSAEHPQKLLSDAESMKLFSIGLQGSVQALRRAGKQVLLVTDVPVLRFDPVRRFSRSATPLRGLIARTFFPNADGAGTANINETYEDAGDQVLAELTNVAGQTGAGIFDTHPNLCNQNQCRFASGDLLFYEDSQHTTPLGSKEALRGLCLQCIYSDHASETTTPELLNESGMPIYGAIFGQTSVYASPDLTRTPSIL